MLWVFSNRGSSPIGARIRRALQLQAADNLLRFYSNQTVEVPFGTYPLKTGAALKAAVDDLSRRIQRRRETGIG